MVRIHGNSGAKPFKPGPRCRDQHSYRKGYSCTTRLTRCYPHRNMNWDLAWETVEMNPETKEAAQAMTSRAKTQRVAIFDEGQWRAADQEIEDNKVNLNQAGLMTGG